VVRALNGYACSCPQARCQSTHCARGAVPSMGNSKVWKYLLPLSSLFSSLSPSDGERRLPRHNKKCGVAKAFTHGNAGSQEARRRARAEQDESLSSKRSLSLARGAVPSTRTQKTARRCSHLARGQVIGKPQPPSTSCFRTNHQLPVQKSIQERERSPANVLIHRTHPRPDDSFWTESENPSNSSQGSVVSVILCIYG